MKILILSLSLIICSCASSQKETLTFKPVERTYRTEFVQIWRAAQLSLSKYPIQVNNMDAGILETQFIKGNNKWSPPFIDNKDYNGNRYKIKIKIIRGLSNSKKSALKVSILKIIQKKKDYFSKHERIPSDGLEEISLLYRIQRELQIDRALERAARKQN